MDHGPVLTKPGTWALTAFEIGPISSLLLLSLSGLRRPFATPVAGLLHDSQGVNKLKQLGDMD